MRSFHPAKQRESQVIDMGMHDVEFISLLEDLLSQVNMVGDGFETGFIQTQRAGAAGPQLGLSYRIRARVQSDLVAKIDQSIR